MIDTEKVEEYISWKKEVGISYLDLYEDFVNPVMDALGDDIDEILGFLNELEDDDLEIMSIIFEDIYKKFCTDDVWDALGELEEKIQ